MVEWEEGAKHQGPKGFRLKEMTVQFVGEDKELGWGLTPTLVITAPEQEAIVCPCAEAVKKEVFMQLRKSASIGNKVNCYKDCIFKAFLSNSQPRQNLEFNFTFPW